VGIVPAELQLGRAAIRDAAARFGSVKISACTA
jgi:hypothetical protein